MLMVLYVGYCACGWAEVPVASCAQSFLDFDHFCLTYYETHFINNSSLNIFGLLLLFLYYVLIYPLITLSVRSVLLLCFVGGVKCSYKNVEMIIFYGAYYHLITIVCSFFFPLMFCNTPSVPK